MRYKNALLPALLATALSLAGCSGSSNPPQAQTSLQPENTVVLCADGRDNDADSLVDCDDPDCGSLAPCQNATRESVCDDNKDNDGDKAVDCKDTDCASATNCLDLREDSQELCTNGEDDDLDDAIDCADEGCQSLASVKCGVEADGERCADGLDNDADGRKDCADPKCYATSHCADERETGCAAGNCCGNDADDDGDGAKDCDDPDCLLDFTVTACSKALRVRDLQDPTDNDLVPVAWRGDGLDHPVRLSGVVVTYVISGNDGPLWWVADVGASGAYTGILVDVASNVDYPSALQAGDVVDLAGFVTESVGETMLLAYAARATGTTAALPAPESPAIADLVQPLPAAEAANDWIIVGPSTGTVFDPDDDVQTAERYEGTLLRLTNVAVTAIVKDGKGFIDYFEITASPPTANGPRFYVWAGLVEPEPLPALQDVYLSISGLMGYFWVDTDSGGAPQYRLMPRDQADWIPAKFIDSDGDTLSDSIERGLRTDPKNADTDGDQIKDGVEVGNPDAPADTDGDGRIDALESLLADADGDEFADQLDAVTLAGTAQDRDGDGAANSTDADDDGDGVCDPGALAKPGVCTYVSRYPDNCPYAPEPYAYRFGYLQDDLDQDDVGDTCDLDLDGDFVVNTTDNCPFTKNTDQQDGDGDGLGNACDTSKLQRAPKPCDTPDDGGTLACDLQIEEVLYNVSAESPVDANHDGTADAEQDVFIEIRNIADCWQLGDPPITPTTPTDCTLSLSGVVIKDSSGTVRHVVPEGVYLRRNQRLVVFGGGTPADFPAHVVAQVASSGSLGLGTTAGTVSVYAANGTTLLVKLDYAGTGQNASLTRYPDGTQFWMEHPLRADHIAGASWKLSPGFPPDSNR